MTKKNIEELFVHNGRDFVTTAYQYILNREPDEQGLMYYMGRLAQGHSKDSVIVQLAKSQECIPHDEITGLKQLISEENRSQHWFWGIVGRRSRMQRYLQGNMYVIALMLKELQALHEVLDSKTHILNKSHEARSTVNQNNVPVRREQTNQFAGAPSKGISKEIVEDIYSALLDRKPESDQIMISHIKHNNLADSIKGIVSSEEFRSIHSVGKEKIKNQDIEPNIFTRLNSIYEKTKNNIVFMEE